MIRVISKGLVLVASVLLSMSVFAKDVPGGGDTNPPPAPTPATVTVACGCNDTFDECFSLAGTASLVQLIIDETGSPGLVFVVTRSSVSPTAPGESFAYLITSYDRITGVGTPRGACDFEEGIGACVNFPIPECTGARLTYSTT